MAERERIAGELQRRVAPRLSRSTTTLAAVLSMGAGAEVTDRLRDVIGELDETLVELRSMVFAD